MTIEDRIPSPEQSTLPVVTEPQFDIFFNANPSVHTALTDVYMEQCVQIHKSFKERLQILPRGLSKSIQVLIGGHL